MTNSYFLTTKHLGFRYWERTDLELVNQLWGNPQVTRFTTAAYQLTQKEIIDRLTSEMQQQEQFGVQYWPFFLKKSQIYLGVCGLHPYDLKQKICELGFHLLPEYWGKGLAEEAARAVIKYAFEFYEMRVLIAGHHPENLSSKKLLLKLGFKYTHDEYYEPTGLYHPTYQRYAS